MDLADERRHVVALAVELRRGVVLADELRHVVALAVELKEGLIPDG